MVNPSDEKGLADEQLLAEQFFDLYKGLDRAYGRFNIDKTIREEDSQKVKGRAITELGDYNVKLWNGHLSGKASVGVVPIQDDGTCWWGAIDIDEYPLDIYAIDEKVRALGLPLIVLRTKSGGAHLTCFVSEPVPCKLMRDKLYQFALVLGYAGVEIFPKQNMLASRQDVGNWLNMPYFRHWETDRYAVLKGKKLSALEFLDLARLVRIDEATLSNITIEVKGAFEDGPPCLQMITMNKIPPGTRNNTLFAIGVYARLKFEDDWEAKVDQMNADYVSPPLSSGEVQGIVKSLARKSYFYPCSKAPLISSCNKDLCRKRQYGIGQGDQDYLLNLGSLIKIATDPPIWIIDVEGVRIQLDTEDLMSQERFRKSCMMGINRLPPRIKNNEWDKILRDKLTTVELVDAPIESRTSGRISQYASQYLTMHPLASKKSELLMGRAWYEEETDTICFQGNALLRFLDVNGVRTEPRKIWSSLRDCGATHGNIVVNGTATPVWRLPAEMMPDIRSKIGAPDMPDNEF
jgi:hypothetical protein